MSLKVTICTPEGEKRIEEVQSLVVISCFGEMAVLPGHAPLVGLLEPGVARVNLISKTERWRLSQGIIEVKQDNEVVLIVEQAEHLLSPTSLSNTIEDS